MKMHVITTIIRNHQRYARAFSSFVTFVAVLCLLGGCSWDPGGIGNINTPIDNVIGELDKTMQTIQGMSSGWQAELPKLVNDLSGIESQASGGMKGTMADAINQVQDLATQSIQFSDAKAQDLIAQAGVEFRCNAGFVKTGVIAQLQYIRNDLEFWKRTRGTLTKSPSTRYVGSIRRLSRSTRVGTTGLLIPVI